MAKSKKGMGFKAAQSQIASEPAAQIPLTVVSYGTTLPGSPVDGQEAILVDSITNPSYQWRFRYNAGSTSTYKWEFIGGTDLFAETQGTDTSTAGTPANLTNGPSITLPRAGDWFVEVVAVASSANADEQCFLVVGDSSLTTAVINSAFAQPTVGGRWGAVYTKGRANGLAASVNLATKVWGTGSGTKSYQNRRLTIRPVRVS